MGSFLQRFLMVGLAVILAADRVSGQSDITVRKPGGDKTTISLAGLSGTTTGDGALFRKVLEQDLLRSGWFVVVPVGRSGLAVRGNFESRGRAPAVSGEVLNSGTGRVYLRQTFRAQPGKARALAHQVADAIVLAVQGVPGFASTRIAMVGARGTQKDIYVSDADGQNIIKVTGQGAVCLSPNWWPDAKSLAYTSFHRGFPDVYRIDLVNLKRHRISAFPGMNAGATVSPDGRQVALALSKDGNPELYAMELRTSRLTRLTRSPHSAEASPAWSPDGSQIAFVSDTSGSPQLYVINARGGSPKRISFRGGENVAPDWGPDGRITYSSRREGRYQVCVYDPRSGATDVLTKAPYDHEDPSWAPDGRHIVYARSVNYQSSLYILDTMGDPQIRLTTLAGDWYSPSWSPR